MPKRRQKREAPKKERKNKNQPPQKKAKRKAPTKTPAKRRSHNPPPTILKRSNLGKYLLKYVFPTPHVHPTFARKPGRLHRFCVKHTSTLLKDAAGQDPHRLLSILSDSDFRKLGIQRRYRVEDIDLDAVLEAKLAAMPSMPKSQLHRCGRCGSNNVSYKQYVWTSPYFIFSQPQKNLFLLSGHKTKDKTPLKRKKEKGGRSPVNKRND